MRKLLSTTIAAGILTAACAAQAFALDPNALPKFNATGSSNVDVTTPGTAGRDMNVKVNGGAGSVGTANWSEFNVGANKTVNFEFTAHNQTSLNRVDAAGGMSQIYGKLTNSCGSNCGYASTSKVILINPNGVLFGDGANVNLNSFTVSTLDGNYANGKLELTKGQTQGKGITVKGATLYGDKALNLVSDNVTVYEKSQLSTSTVNNSHYTNGNELALGKIKIVTADGVNFTYLNNGAVSDMKEFVASNDKMNVQITDSNLTSGQIDIRNYSSNNESDININRSTLKAVKAVEGNDGNIYLTANNKAVVDESRLSTEKGGKIRIYSGNLSSVKASDLNSATSIEITSEKGDAVADSSILTAATDIDINAKNIASVQKNSKLTAKNIRIKSGKDAWASYSDLDAITLEAAIDVKTNNVNFNNKKTTVTAGQDVDLSNSKGLNSQYGLVASAGRNMNVTTDSTLSVSSLVAKNDMNLKAQAVKAGAGKTTNYLEKAGDSNDRAYIEVGGTFTSNPEFTVTKSAELNADQTAQKRHHIQYGNEKILLVNDRPYTPGQPSIDPVAPEQPSINADDQAQMLNRIPRQPESYNNNAIINNGRTTFVDVFAAASQIEIADDEEE